MYIFLSSKVGKIFKWPVLDASLGIDIYEVHTYAITRLEKKKEKTFSTVQININMI